MDTATAMERGVVAVERGVLAMERMVLQRRLEELNARVRNYETRVESICSTYFRWQRFLFLFISHDLYHSSSSTLCCNDWWMVVLSIYAAAFLVYMLFFLDAAVMLYQTEHMFDVIFPEPTGLGLFDVVIIHSSYIGRTRRMVFNCVIFCFLACLSVIEWWVVDRYVTANKAMCRIPMGTGRG